MPVAKADKPMPAVTILDKKSRFVILRVVKAFAASMINVFLSCSLKLISSFSSVTSTLRAGVVDADPAHYDSGGT
jgi:hypothetical protein